MSVPLNAAYAAVGRLAAATTGWSEEAIEDYARELADGCHDPNALHDAARDLAHSWTDRSRPTLAVVFEAYRTVCRRKAMSAPSQPMLVEGCVDVRRGRLVASEAYATERRRLGHEPNPAFFNRIAAAIPSEPPEESHDHDPAR